MMGGGEKKKKQLSGAQKRKKKREKEDLAAEMERLKLGPSKLWTGLVLHHKDVFVTHVIPKLNTTDRFFFSKVNKESRVVLEVVLDLSPFHLQISLPRACDSTPIPGSCLYEQTRVPQVGERSETVRVG